MRSTYQIQLMSIYFLLGLLGTMIAWILSVFGGFAIAGLVLTGFKVWLQREREYSEASFNGIARGALIIPMAFSYIFLPRAGFSGDALFVSLLVIGYLVIVCFTKPLLLRSFSNILTAILNKFMGIYYGLLAKAKERK